MISPFKISLYTFIFLGTLLIVAINYLDWSWYIFIGLCILYSFVLFLGSYFIRLNFYLPSVNKLPQRIVDFHDEISSKLLGNSVMLSFDDGPHEYTERILDILKENDVPATFFVIGNHILNREHVIKRMYAEGHQIGNHSYYHKASFDWQSVKAMLEEINLTNYKIYEVIGVSPHLFRPPFGVTNPNLAKAVSKAGMTSIGWNVRSYDTIAKDENKLLDKIVKNTQSGSIILLHDSIAITVKILPKLIKELRQRGYNFTTI